MLRPGYAAGNWPVASPDYQNGNNEKDAGVDPDLDASDAA